MAGTGPKDSEGGKEFCIETDLTYNSVQGGTGGVPEDHLLHDSMREPRDHDAPNDGVRKNNNKKEGIKKERRRNRSSRK